MNLTRKVLLIIACLLLVQFCTFYLSARALFLRSFARLEEQYALRSIDRAMAFLESQEQNLLTLAKDWAAWDDTYYFIQEPSEDYIKSNLVDETFEGLKLNFMLFLDSSGELVYGKAYDLDLHREVPLPEGWKEHFSDGSPLLIHRGPADGKVGLITLPSGPALVAIHPIVTSEEKGPIMGTLVMGCYFNEAWAERLSEMLHLPVSFLALSDPQLPSELIRGENFALRFPDPRTLEAFAMLRDLYGRPALALKVTRSRELYRQSQVAFSYFSLLILFTGILFGGAILIFLRRHLLSRLARLSGSLRAIALSGDTASRVPVEGKDELAELEQKLNDLLASLEESHRALRESESWYRLLVNSITDGLWVVDQSLRLREVNETGARFLGTKSEDLIGRSLEEFLKEPSLSDFHEAFRRAVERKTIHTLSMPDSSGERTLEVRLYPLPDGALCIARDVTELKQMESFYLRAQRMEAAGRVALAIAHDFKNFLTPLLAGLDLLLSGAIPPKESRALLEEMKNSCEKAVTLTRQLLLFGRGEIPAVEAIDLNALIGEMEGLIARTLGGDVELVLDLAPHLWPIKASRGHIEQIIMNLVINARDAMPGGGRLTLRTENVQLKEEALTHPEAYPGKFVRLTVKDTGVGIPPEVMEHIFEPFFTTKGTGAGLGLSVVYSLVKQYRGWIELKSRPGEGAAFHLYFPALDGGEAGSW